MKNSGMQKLLEHICKAENIHLDPAPWLKSCAGMALAQGESRAIIYKPSLAKWDKFTVIAHELGHHAMGHLDSHAAYAQTEQNELEAQVFSAVFTAMGMFMSYLEGCDGL